MSNLPPHPVLARHYGEAQERARYVRSLFDRNAASYDLINRVMSLGSGNWYRRRMLRAAGLEAGDEVLDIAIGTGLTAREALRIVGAGGRVVGIDTSPGMLAQARRRCPDAALVEGSADALPFKDQSFDMVSMGYAVRHVADLGQAFAEFGRVLRPGGRLLILELGRAEKEPARTLFRLYLRRVVPFAAFLLTGRRTASDLMSYYWATIEACVPPSTILRALEGAGLADVSLSEELGGLRAYTARRA